MIFAIRTAFSPGRKTETATVKDIVSPTAAQITTEMVKQNYNHPSIVVWSMGNESNAAVADECVPVAKALDPSRPVGVANMKSELADFRTKQ